MSDHVRAARLRDLDGVAALIHRFDGRIGFVAGGTDLIIAQEGIPWPDLVVDVSRIAGLDFVHVGGGTVHVGAATTMTSLAGHKDIRRMVPMLAQAAALVGSVQVRNRATIGGNIASAAPAGDLLPVLKCAEARIDILRRDGHRERLGFDDVVIGRGETCLANGDLIIGITLPLKYGTFRTSAFAKIGIREVPAIARLNMAIAADFDHEGNRVRDIRIVAGAIGPVPLRLRPVEAVFRGRAIDQSLARDFVAALSVAVDHAIAGRPSQPYKRRAIAGMGLDLLHDLFGHEFDLGGRRGKRA